MGKVCGKGTNSPVDAVSMDTLHVTEDVFCGVSEENPDRDLSEVTTPFYSQAHDTFINDDHCHRNAQTLLSTSMNNIAVTSFVSVWVIPGC